MTKYIGFLNHINTRIYGFNIGPFRFLMTKNGLISKKYPLQAMPSDMLARSLCTDVTLLGLLFSYAFLARTPVHARKNLYSFNMAESII